MKSLILLALVCGAAAGAAAQTTPAAQVPSSAPASAAKFNLDTPVEEIVASPAAKAVLDKELPGLSTNENYETFKTTNLRTLAQFDPKLSTDLLTKVEAGLAKVR